MEYLLYLATGALAGTLSGLLGLGGGIVVVPALVFILASLGFPQSHIMHVAAGTSLAAMIVTASVSVRSHYRRGNVDWQIVKLLLPGVIIGVIAGALLAGVLTTHVLIIILSIVLLLSALRMFYSAKQKPTNKKLPVLIIMFCSLLIGLKSGLLGLGGGILIVPLLSFFGVDMRKASGTSAACTLPIAIVGTITFIFTGMHADAGHLQSGYVYWPAFIGIVIGSALFVPVGAALGAKLNRAVLRRIFAVILVIVAAKLLIG